MGTGIRYRFNIYKIAEQDNAVLLATDNPFALVVLTAKTAFAGKHIKDSSERDKTLPKMKVELLRQLLSRSIPKDKIRVLMDFLTYYIRFENQEIK